MTNYLGIDFGTKRVGLATASGQAKIAYPLTTLENNAHFWQNLGQVVRQEGISQIVVGLPRGLSAQETAMSKAVREFARQLELLGLQIHLQDEAATSGLAKDLLRQSSQHVTKADVDSQAAALILQDYLDNLQ